VGRQAQIIILEILQCIPVVIVFAFLDLGKNISFSDSLLQPNICPVLGWPKNNEASVSTRFNEVIHATLTNPRLYKDKQEVKW